MEFGRDNVTAGESAETGTQANEEPAKSEPTRRRVTGTLLKCSIAVGGCIVFGTACHEVIGHGALGVALGGRIASVKVLGVQLYPSPGWVGTGGIFGSCSVVGLELAWEDHLVSLGGSMSTWCMSVTAVCLLWWRGWPRRVHFLLICVSLWWIDLFTYTLPSFGLRRYVILGRRLDEPYQAATALGVPGPVFQTFVCGSCAILALALALRLRRSQLRMSCGVEERQ